MVLQACSRALAENLTRPRELLREIEKQGIKIPHAVPGWMLLRRQPGTRAETLDAVTTKAEEVMYYYKERWARDVGSRHMPQRTNTRTLMSLTTPMPEDEQVLEEHGA